MPETRIIHGNQLSAEIRAVRKLTGGMVPSSERPDDSATNEIQRQRCVNRENLVGLLALADAHIGDAGIWVWS